MRSDVRGTDPAPRGTRDDVSVDPQWLSDTIGAIYDCALDPSRWSSVIGVIAERYSFASGLLGIAQIRDAIHEVRISYRMDDAWLHDTQRYAADMVALQGGAVRIQTYPLDEPIVSSQLLPPEERRANRYYREMLEPRGMTDAVLIGLAREPRLVGYLALNRADDTGPIRQDEVQGLRLIAPHLRRAVTIGNLFDLKAVELATVHSVLNGLASAVILVEDDLRIVHANTAGETMLSVGTLLSAVQGRLSVRGRFGQDALRAAVTAAARNESTLGQRGIGIPATSDDGATAVLHVLPLTRGEVRAGLSLRAVAAVFAVADGAHAPVDGIAALYDLTPAEALIFASLAKGTSLEETAAALGIAKSTARTHLLRVFAKTGCSRQAELVALASRLSLPL